MGDKIPEEALHKPFQLFLRSSSPKMKSLQVQDTNAKEHSLGS
jgi:hypothetical protein